MTVRLTTSATKVHVYGDPAMTDALTPSSITDVPLGGLPSADKTLLAQAPLEVAIVEVRFTTAATEVPASAVVDWRDALAATLEVDLPNIQPATQGTMHVDFNNEGPSAWAGDQINGWQIASNDGQHNLTIFPSSLVWQVGSYERWASSMRAPLEVLLHAVGRDLAPTLIQRVGLRYVDRFVDPTCKNLTDWFGKIDGALLGPLGNQTFGQMVQQAHQQVELVIDGSHGALLRHGPIRDKNSKGVDYLLDLDVFAHAAGPFNPSDVLDGAERLNRTALSLFQACVSADYLKSLQGEEAH